MLFLLSNPEEILWNIGGWINGVLCVAGERYYMRSFVGDYNCLMRYCCSDLF